MTIEFKLKEMYGVVLWLEGNSPESCPGDELTAAVKTVCIRCPFQDACRPQIGFRRGNGTETTVIISGTRVSNGCRLTSHGININKLNY